MKAGGEWRIKLDELGIVVRTEKEHVICDGRELLSERNNLFLMGVDLDETTKYIQGRRTLSREAVEERRKEYLDICYPSVHRPRVVGMGAVSQMLKTYGITWEDYKKLVS